MNQEKTFGEVLERKEAFLDYQHIDLQKSQNLHFSEGLVHGFGQKMNIFPSLVLLRYGQEKSLLKLLKKTEAFLDFKKINSKAQKFAIF